MGEAATCKESLQLLMDAGAKLAEPIDHPQGGQVILVPEGLRSEHLKPLYPDLEQIKQKATFDDTASFVDYFNSFKDSDSRIFADIDNARLTAIIDYHQSDESAPRHCVHVAIYRLKHSEEWKRWTGVDGVEQTQRGFARFLEENLLDIQKPDGATVLEAAASLAATKKVSFESGINLRDGTVQIEYREDIEEGTKGTLSVPAELMLGIAVYFGGELYEMKAFLRFDIADGNLKYKVDLHRREHVEQDAFQKVVEQIGTETKVTPLYGSAVYGSI